MGDVEEENHTSQSIDKLPSEEEEFGGIPKSSINQIVKSVFAETAEDSSIEVSRISQEARDAMATCGVTFIRQITDESFSLFSESSSKKTMSHDYIIRVLNQHGLNWVSDKCLSVAEESKVMITAAKKRKSGRKLEALGIPYEELLRQQEALIEEARKQMEMECSAEEMDVLQRELAESSASAQLTGAIVGQCTAATGSSGTHEDEDFDI